MMLLPKQTLIRDQRHLAQVRAQPCCCGPEGCDGPVHAHHLRTTDEAGLSRRSGDDKTIPLCAFHHLWPTGLHGDGDEERFLARFGINGLAFAADLYAEGKLAWL